MLARMQWKGSIQLWGCEKDTTHLENDLVTSVQWALKVSIPDTNLMETYPREDNNIYPI